MRAHLGWCRRPRRGAGSDRAWRKAVFVGLFAAVALTGCGRGYSRLAVAPPPDPPPIPLRKPPVPQDSLAALKAPKAAWAKPAPVSSNSVTSKTVTSKTVARAPLASVPKAPIPKRAPVKQARAQTAPGRDAGYVYVVQRGDTVYGVSRKLGVPLRDVMDANSLRPPYSLSVSQTLRIPNPRRHTVKRGETVYGISRGYGVEMSELVKLNRITPPYTISPGARLVLPAALSDGRSGTALATITAARDGSSDKLEPAAKTAPRAVQKAAVPQTAPRAAPKATKPARLAAIPKPPPRAGRKFLWPAKGKLLMSFGPKKGGLHNDGINIAAPRGTPVRAAENGVVVYSGNELRGFGNLILIKHAEGWVTAYAHTEQSQVSRGQRVKRGQTIARVGSTGNVSRPQLHFEVRKGSRPVDPRRHLAPKRAAAGTAG